MSISDELTAAIAAHASWKFRLKSAIDSGTLEIPVATIRVDNACAFGKWLASVPLNDRGAKFDTVKRLHADFHTKAADVATLALSGKGAEAHALMATGGSYCMASTALTTAMTAWRQSV